MKQIVNRHTPPSSPASTGSKKGLGNSDGVVVSGKKENESDLLASVTRRREATSTLRSIAQAIDIVFYLALYWTTWFPDQRVLNGTLLLAAITLLPLFYFG